MKKTILIILLLIGTAVSCNVQGPAVVNKDTIIETKAITPKEGEEFFLEFGQTARVNELELTYVAVQDSDADIEKGTNGDVVTLRVGNESRTVVFNGFNTTVFFLKGYIVNFSPIKRERQTPIKLKIQRGLVPTTP